MAKLAARGRGRRTINEINMVPFIDVMLVLLIIFMVTAPLITPSQIALPSVGQAARQPDSYVQVIIDKDEQIQVRPGNSSADTPPVPMGQLVARVRQLQTEGTEGGTPVIISADKRQVRRGDEGHGRVAGQGHCPRGPGRAGRPLSHDAHQR